MIMKIIAVLKNPVVKMLFLTAASNLISRYSAATLEVLREKLDEARETNKGDKDASQSNSQEKVQEDLT